MARSLSILFVAVALAATVIRAQPPAPRIGFVYPAGGQQGRTVTVSVGGQNLNGASGAIVSGVGVEVRVAGYERPLTQREINDLREEAERLVQKRATAGADSTPPAFTGDDEKRAAEIRQLLATRGNRQFAPAIAETVTLEIAIAPGVMPGERELRVKTPGGVSNPIAFSIGQLPEMTRPAATSTSPRPGRRSSDPEVSLPAIINGQILPGKVDRYRFDARKGQRLTFAVSARALMPYLADAVPGWFQATLAIRDAQGRELAYADDYRFTPDPVIAVEIPADGKYLVEIKDALFRGREDFVYRIAAGELPFISSVFPLGSTPGRRTSIELNGWNLPRRQMMIDATDRSPGSLLLSVPSDGVFSNSVRFALDATADCTAAEEDETIRAATLLELPVIVNGRIDRPGDDDRFHFAGRAGDTIVAEVNARRLGSPLDAVLTLLDDNGRTIATNDDTDDRGTGLLTHHADSRIVHRLPADGVYTVRIADAQHSGGPEHGYRLRLSAPQPSFELRVTPSSINLRAGATVPITVHALRRDGFDGEIALGLANAPAGFVLSGARIPPGADSIRLTLTAPARSPGDSFAPWIVGRATINGVTVTRGAVPADDMMQAFAYHHLVTAQELRVCVVGRGSTLRILNPTPLQLAPGKPARIRVALPPGKDASSFVFELMDPPAGIVVAKTSQARDVAEIVVECDAAKATPGTAGNLILQVFSERPNAASAKSGQRAQRSPVGLLPAVPFEVAPSLHASL